MCALAILYLYISAQRTKEKSIMYRNVLMVKRLHDISPKLIRKSVLTTNVRAFYSKRATLQTIPVLRSMNTGHCTVYKVKVTHRN